MELMFYARGTGRTSCKPKKSPRGHLDSTSAWSKAGANHTHGTARRKGQIKSLQQALRNGTLIKILWKIFLDIAFFVFCTRFLATFRHMWELPHWICLSFRCCKGSSKCSSSSSGTFGSMSRGSSMCSLLYRSRCPRDTAWYGVCHSKSSEWTQVSSIRCKSTALFAEICVTELFMTEVYPAPAVKSNMLKHVRGT